LTIGVRIEHPIGVFLDAKAIRRGQLAEAEDRQQLIWQVLRSDRLPVEGHFTLLYVVEQVLVADRAEDLPDVAHRRLEVFDLAPDLVLLHHLDQHLQTEQHHPVENGEASLVQGHIDETYEVVAEVSQQLVTLLAQAARLAHQSEQERLALPELAIEVDELHCRVLRKQIVSVDFVLGGVCGGLSALRVLAVVAEAKRCCGPRSLRVRLLVMDSVVAA